MTKIMNYYKILIIEYYSKIPVGANIIRSLHRKTRNVKVQHAEPLRKMAVDINMIHSQHRKIRNVRVQHAEPLRKRALIHKLTKIFNENKKKNANLYDKM
jgi:hypothetical protein